MSLGGNQSLKDFFKIFDLHEAQPSDSLQFYYARYKTNAASYYRCKLGFMVNQLEFDDLAPTYDEGRKHATEQPIMKQTEAVSNKPVVSEEERPDHQEVA